MGVRGWFPVPLLWVRRSLAARLGGGVGLRCGRRDPESLLEGDVVDCWRVERIERGRLLRLRAEMRVPGRAWLELEVTPSGTGAHYRQRAVFLPSGLSGRLYWWSLVPAHQVIFDVMASRIVAAAEAARS